MAKQFLDSNGLNTLWTRIMAVFAPSWKAIDINNVKIVPTANNLILELESTGYNPDSSDTNNIYRSITIPAVTTTNSGVMSAEDKRKLDELNTNIETSVSFKGLKINNETLTLSNKIANFDLVYNNITDTIDIIDLNSVNDGKSKVLTSVNINSFIGDALLSGVLSNVELVNSDNNNNTGTFLKLVFTVTKNDGSSDTSTIYANVADLVSTYEQGTGIKITSTNTEIDNTVTTAKIELKPASTNEIGGIKVSNVFTTDPTPAVATTYSGRYLPIEMTSTGQAIVNVPSNTITMGSAESSTDNLAHGGTVDIMTGLTPITNSEDGSTTLTPNIVKYTLPSVPDITVTANNSDTINPTHNGTFTIVSKIEKNGHGLKYQPTTVTLPNETILSVSDIDTDDYTLIPGRSNEVTLLETINVNNHNIQRNLKKISVEDPAIILDNTINDLKYLITDSNLPDNDVIINSIPNIVAIDTDLELDDPEYKFD